MVSTDPSKDPQIRGLCRAFITNGENVDSLDNPSFQRLVVAAGGPERVSAFCHALLASPTPTAS
jgi:hypothetical protein